MRTSTLRGSNRVLCRCLIGWLLAWPVLVGAATGEGEGEARLLDDRRMLRVEGRSRFILGMYENPADDAELEQAVRSGFNLFQCAPEAAALDRLHRLGAKGWVNLGEALDLSVEGVERAARLEAVVDRLAGHPALLVWEGPDEILWNQWWVPMETLRAELRSMRAEAGSGELAGLAERARMLMDRGLYREFEQVREEYWRQRGRPCPNPRVRIDDAAERVRRVGEGITAGIRRVRSRDPKHVIWLNHAPRNSLEDLRWFNREADMVGCDIYPVPANLDVSHSDLKDLSMASVGAYTRRMRAAAESDRACAMVLQGFGWRDLREDVTEAQLALGLGRQPTFGESRFMAYDAILHGANAILYWGTPYAKVWGPKGVSGKGRPGLWQDLLRLGRELRALEPALVARPVEGLEIGVAPTFGSHEAPALVASLRRVDEEFVLLLANESPHGLRFTVGGLPKALDGRTLHRLSSDETREVSGGRLEDGIRGMEVHVYATSRRFEPAVR